MRILTVNTYNGEHTLLSKVFSTTDELYSLKPVRIYCYNIIKHGMLRPYVRANDARANHCSVKNESGRVAPLPPPPHPICHFVVESLDNK